MASSSAGATDTTSSSHWNALQEAREKWFAALHAAAIASGESTAVQLERAHDVMQAGQRFLLAGQDAGFVSDLDCEHSTSS